MSRFSNLCALCRKRERTLSCSYLLSVPNCLKATVSELIFNTYSSIFWLQQRLRTDPRIMIPLYCVAEKYIDSVRHARKSLSTRDRQQWAWQDGCFKANTTAQGKTPCQQLLPNVLLITVCVRGEETHWDAPNLSQNIRTLFSPSLTKYLLFLHLDMCFGTGNHC